MIGGVKSHEDSFSGNLCGNGTDACPTPICLVIETGHFDIEDARNYLADKQVRRIFFSHNGREILRSPDTARNKVEQYFSGKAVICEDGMTVEL